MKKSSIIAAALMIVCLLASHASAVTTDAAEQWIKEHAPKIAKDIDIVRSIDPGIAMEILEEAAVEIPEGEELRLADPKLFAFFLGTEELEVRSIRLAVQLAVETDAKKKSTMQAEIKSLVEKVFQQRLEQHQIIVDEIERELNELKRMGKVRKANHKKIVEQRYNYLIDPDSEALEWW